MVEFSKVEIETLYQDIESLRVVLKKSFLPFSVVRTFTPGQENRFGVHIMRERPKMKQRERLRERE